MRDLAEARLEVLGLVVLVLEVLGLVVLVLVVLGLVVLGLVVLGLVAMNKLLLTLLLLFTLVCGWAESQGTPPFAPDPKAQAISNSLRQPTSVFASTANVIVPDPILWLQRTTDGITRINLTSKIEVVAYLILFMGMVYSLYQGWWHGDAKMILGAFVRSSLCGICIMFTFNHAVVEGGSVPGSKSFSFSSIMFGAWGSAYGWSGCGDSAYRHLNSSHRRSSSNSIAPVSSVVGT